MKIRNCALSIMVSFIFFGGCQAVESDETMGTSGGTENEADDDTGFAERNVCWDAQGARVEGCEEACGGIEWIECGEGLECWEVDDCMDTDDGPGGICISASLDFSCKKTAHCDWLPSKGCAGGDSGWFCNDEKQCEFRCDCDYD